MKKTLFKSVMTTGALMLLLAASVSAQSLYTKGPGNDPTWNYIKNNNLIPIGTTSHAGITGTTIDVNQNHPLISSSPYANRAIQQGTAIHTLGNATVQKKDFYKWSRWYQEDGNTQIFRLFKGEINVRNATQNKPRIEAELGNHSKGTKINNGADWVEWSGTYTIVDPVESNIFQIWSSDDYVLMLEMNSSGRVRLNPRDQSGHKIMLNNATGKSFHVRVRDYGNKYEVYLDGKMFYSRNYSAKYGNSRAAHFRWGIYASRKSSDKNGVPDDGLMFVTGAQRRYSNDVDDGNTGGTNNAPSVSITSPNNGQEFNPGETVSVNVNANDSDGNVTEHKVYVNGTLVDTDGASYTAHQITNVQPGTYTVKVTVKDNDGATSEATSTFTVKESDDGGNNGGSSGSCAFEEQGGVVAFEAEDFFAQELTSKREWFVIGGGGSTPTPDPDGSHASSASGNRYIEILPDTRVTHDDPLVHGESFSNDPGQLVVVNYKVFFNNTGRYYVWVRAFSTGSEDNGVHVGLDGNWPASGARLQWCTGKNQWTWESKQRTDANHCGEAQKIYLDINTPGEHVISFSMREDGFEMDKIVLSKTYTKPSGSGPTVASTDCDNTPTGDVNVSGELKRWHKVTLTMDGPNTSETANPNPFMDYRCDVTFTHSSGASYKVPGYYAACDNPAEGCTSGNKWKAHFAPDRTGTWNYSIDFKTGSKVAINSGGSSAGYFDGASGSISVSESDKSGRDFRAKEQGKLRYVGEHYLRFTGTGGNNANGDYFFKAGADAPENTLAYNDFDNTPNRGNRRKTWSPHQQDYSASEASSYTWKGGKGTELLGVVRYLSDKGVNAFSFLTLSIHGDDENVFPHLMKVGESTYNGYNDAQQWNNGVHHNRFDVSKLAQWENVFEYADTKGMFLHFKTMETENDNMMDNDNFGDERKVYYRELIARFGHHLALNWNLSEESTMTDNVVKQTASYIKSIDPYDNHIVLHTYPNQKDQRYDPLLGNSSELTGASLQTSNSSYAEVKSDVQKWLNKSANANKKWVVCVDEPGNASIGIDNDDNGSNDKLVRNKVLWATLLSGGMGVEYYYGYQTGETDLSAQDHRSRNQKYSEASMALSFMRNYLGNKVVEMKSADNVTSDNGDHVLAKAGEIYAIYRPNGGSTAISLPGSGWSVQWYNPRSGGSLTSATSISNSLVAPNGNDWVALVTKGTTTDPNDAPTVTFTTPVNGSTFDSPADIAVLVDATDNDGSIDNVKLYLDGVLVRQENVFPYEWGMASQDDASLQNLPFGSYQLKAVATDNDGATSEAVITVTVTSDDITEVCVNPTHDAYLQGSTRFNTDELRVESGNRVSYLKFDLSSISGNILSSKLTLGVGTDAGDGNIDVNLGTSNNWTERNLSSSNAPGKGMLLGSINTNYAVGSTHEWNLTGLNGGGNTSLVISHTSGNDVSFDSKEGTTAPQLCMVVEASSGPVDCNGDVNGTASIDACGVCSGGNTGITPSSPKTWYADADGDGFGDPNTTIEQCDQPTGYVSNSTDQCPNDQIKQSPGECGCGVAEGTCSNSAPIVTFTKPLNGDTYGAGVTLIANVTATDDGSIDNVKLYLNGTLVRQENFATYDWNHNGQDPLLQNMAAGTYTLLAVATDDEGVTGESTITITIEEPVVVETDPILGDDCAVKNGIANFELNPDIVSNSSGISWWFSGSSSSVISPAEAPSTVEVTMSQYYKGGEVCAGVNLNQAPWYETYCKSVGVCSDAEPMQVEGIEVNEYPNPVDGNSITVEVNETAGDIISVELLDGSGDVKLSTSELTNGGSIDLSNIPSGSYILRVVTENGVANKRVVKL